MERRERPKGEIPQGVNEFFYRQWYVCKNKACKTGTVTFNEDKVYPRAANITKSKSPLPAVNPDFSAWEGPPIRVMFIGEFMREFQAGRLSP
jgi:hypothetical protein